MPFQRGGLLKLSVAMGEEQAEVVAEELGVQTMIYKLGWIVYDGSDAMTGSVLMSITFAVYKIDFTM